jgi:signal peptidase II
MKITIKRPIFTLLMLVLLDQATKYLILTRLALGETVTVTPHFQLTHVVNTGVAFSMFQGANAFFAVFTAVVLAAIAFWYRKNRAQLTAGMKTALLFIVAGACGNLIDRLVHGHVIDFITVWLGSYPWPSFNVADSCITVGGVILFFILLRPDRGSRAPAAKE